MILHTASQVISLARKLEDDSAEFYKELFRKYGRDEAIFLSFAEENRKNIAQVERTYYGAITDAIEGCFAFNIEEDNYAFEADLAQNAKYADALEKAIQMEDTIIKFYSDAAGQSQSLMADLPRVFNLITKKRSGRMSKLESLLAAG